MKILFQGDSITDCNRNRADNGSMGVGYPLLVKSKLSLEKGKEYEFVNRGISGNRISDVYARIKMDLINLAPDYMSILIGVNDVWHEIDRQNGADDDEFYFLYDRLITKVKEALPNIKIAILEPFVLEGPATANNEEMPNRFDRFQKGVAQKAAIAKEIAQKHDLAFIPLQQKFNQAAARLGADVLTPDGVHPHPAGHQLIADEWLSTFTK
ncbi:MAG: SGNH/GDSL hydrolase family protein [Clostridia bacterium]|nr:SGNH/GDSL hydrolase family protein [Clostridia bacterium]